MVQLPVVCLRRWSVLYANLHNASCIEEQRTSQPGLSLVWAGKLAEVGSMFLAVQLLLTLVLGTAAVVALRAIFYKTFQTPYEVVCSITVVLVILARPACWKSQSLISLFLSVGTLAPLAYLILFVQPNSVISIDTQIHLYFGLRLGIALVFLLGILLLGQSERVVPDQTQRPEQRSHVQA
jgi:hypothetical protein